VSKGTQQILDLLPVTEVSAADLLREGGIPAGTSIAKVVFREADTVERIDADRTFDLQEYYDHPDRYRGVFGRYLPHLHALVNCIYWEPRYPRLVTREDLRTLYDGGQPKLRVIGDITCDVEGSIESTVKATEPNDPVYVYDPKTGDCARGVEGEGPAMMAVEILPSELPRESSTFFSHILKEMVSAIAQTEPTAGFDAYALPPELKRAVIVYRGSLTPAYRYLEEHLAAASAA
jgi:alpha-aminoadipic semialdehyde synthase